ncbi:DUF3995 domain-containing protein [Streptomyces sp. 6-11-2]|uniref:DUF3995 domain-containing protein n=1 Tax=unclassified Streptomyces TaxID=2593676 RepID=UPI00155AFFD9|nr:DUF3995 domain-containing protein [Streptomyces sp. 6-11-2]
MLLHVYWAVGGTWGLPLLARHNKSAVQAVNWVVSALMLFGALFVLALNRRTGSRVRAWVLLVPMWIAAVVCVSHALYGFVTKALYLSGRHGAVDFPVVPGVGTAEAAEANHLSAVQDLLVFEPCFMVQGVVLALAAWQFIRTRSGRRKWWTSLAVGIVVIDVFGALLSLAGARFALS